MAGRSISDNDVEAHLKELKCVFRKFTQARVGYTYFVAAMDKSRAEAAKAVLEAKGLTFRPFELRASKN